MIGLTDPEYGLLACCISCEEFAPGDERRVNHGHATCANADFMTACEMVKRGLLFFVEAGEVTGAYPTQFGKIVYAVEKAIRSGNVQVMP